MFFNYKNCLFTLSGQDILATDVNLSIDSKNTPIYREESKKNAYTYTNDDIPDTKFSVTYYLTGKDPIKDYLLGGNSDAPITGSFCGFSFSSGYINSYSIKGQPNSLVKTDLQIVVLDQLQGSFASNPPTQKQTIVPLNFNDFYISGNITGSSFDTVTNNITSFSYGIQRDITKYQREGTQYFSGSDARAYIGKRNQILTFEVDNVDYVLPLSGLTAAMTINIRNTGTIFDTLTLSGILNSKKTSIQSQGYLKSEFTLRQDSTHLKPIITDFTPRFCPPGTTVTINGLNFINVKNVYFGNIPATSFTNPTTLVITAVSPATVKGPTPISIETDESYSTSIINLKPSLSVPSLTISTQFLGL